MNTNIMNRKQEDIRLRAKNLMYRTERLVEQFDDWLPSDEANENMIREIKSAKVRKRKSTKSIKNLNKL